MLQESTPPHRDRIGVLGRDLRHGVRKLIRSPGPSSIVVGTLGIGIGLSAVVFMFADIVLFKPLPYPDASRLVTIEARALGKDWISTSEPELIDLETLESFEAVSGFSGTTVTLDAEGAADGVAVRVAVMRTTAPFFSILGIEPALGRTYRSDEDVPGADEVVVISHDFWQDTLGGAEPILGMDLRLGGTPHRIIGVMPPGFHFPSAWPEVWRPLRIDRADPWERNNHYMDVVARLSDGATLESARAELQTSAARASLDYPDAYGDQGLTQRVRRTQEVIGASLQRPAALVFSAVGLLLLLTCANVANIQLARGASRVRELSVRTSLGASRRRLVALLVTESSVLALAGAVLALAMAFAAQSLLPKLLPGDTPRLSEIALDERVLIFTLAVGFACTLVFGLWPALRSTRGSLVTAGSSRHQGTSRTLRSSLVIAQMTVAVLLLVGCGFVARSLLNLAKVDLGFDPDRVLVLDASPPESVYDTPEKTIDFYHRAEQALASIAGVTKVGAVARLPLASGLDNWSIVLEGREAADVGSSPAARVRQVTPDYFESLGLRLIEGRFFRETDRAGSEPVVIVNQAMADEHWPGQDPIGKRMRVFAGDPPFMTIVGVVETIRDRDPAVAGEAEWYVPHAQAFESAYYSPRDMTFVVRTEMTKPTDLLPTVRSALHEIDDRVVLLDGRDFSAIVRGALAQPRLLTAWLALFAATALALGAAGLYGVLSYTVVLRRVEFGVRLSLGAEPAGILQTVLREGIGLCTIGLVVGTSLGLLAARLASSLLYRVELADPMVLVGTAVVLLSVCLVVAAAPALRASRTDPAKALVDP